MNVFEVIEFYKELTSERKSRENQNESGYFKHVDESIILSEILKSQAGAED